MQRRNATGYLQLKLIVAVDLACCWGALCMVGWVWCATKHSSRQRWWRRQAYVVRRRVTALPSSVASSPAQTSHLLPGGRGWWRQRLTPECPWRSVPGRCMYQEAASTALSNAPALSPGSAAAQQQRQDVAAPDAGAQPQLLLQDTVCKMLLCCFAACVLLLLLLLGCCRCHEAATLQC